MKLNRKWILVMSLVLSLALATGSTLAYLTSTETVTNTFTVGNVSIDLFEEEAWSDSSYKPTLLPGVEIAKTPQIKNTGKTDAWVWMEITVPTDLKEYIDWNTADWTKTETVSGTNTIVTMKRATVLAADETTSGAFTKVALPAALTSLPESLGTGTINIVVKAFAIQDSFSNVDAAYNAFHNITEVGTVDELTAALNDGASVELNDDITDIPVDNTAPYGNYYGILLKPGQTIDGNEHTLDFQIGDLKNGMADNYGIMASGGTLKNATVTGVFRGVMIMNPTETVTIDNCVIGDKDVCYAINTGEGSTNPQDLIVSNTTIKGWNSYGKALKSIRFTNCKFQQGEYYDNVVGRLVRPFVNAVFDSCDFISTYYIDLSKLGADQKIVLRNCTVNGVKLTADNWKTLIAPEDTCGDGQISIEGRDNTYMQESNVFDYVVIE